MKEVGNIIYKTSQFRTVTPTFAGAACCCCTAAASMVVSEKKIFASI